MVYFHQEDVTYSLKKSTRLKSWIQGIIKLEKKKTGTINFIFCSDEYLLALNQQYLKHNYYTDVIAFDQSADKQAISGDIYISIDRVKENAIKHAKQTTNNRIQTTDKELHRVMVHGVLHLLGYNDKKISSRKLMKMKEDEYLKMKMISV